MVFGVRYEARDGPGDRRTRGERAMEKNRLAGVEVRAECRRKRHSRLPHSRSRPTEKRLPLMDFGSRRHQNSGDDPGCWGDNRSQAPPRASGSYRGQWGAGRNRLIDRDPQARQTTRDGGADHGGKPGPHIPYGRDKAWDGADNSESGMDCDLAPGGPGRVVGAGAKTCGESDEYDTLDIYGHCESS